jgi:tRNA threonylcarbamoyladenosine biosynthesis protein TsaB
MSILAFDTCLGAVSVAVRRQDADGVWKLFEAYEERVVGHAERLMPMIDACMASAALEFSSLRRIAVSIGPGTFTGVRTGIATARALALVTGVPVVGLTSLALIAHRARAESPNTSDHRAISVVVDARRGAFYMQTFAGIGLAAVSEPSLASPDDVRSEIAHFDAAAVGSGVPLIEGIDGVALLPPGSIAVQPHARILALLAETLTPQSEIKPLYLRPPDAKAQTANVLPRAL